MKAKTPNYQLSIIIGLVIFGGLPGITVLVYDYFKRAQYSPTAKLDLSQSSKPLIIFLVGLIGINISFQSLPALIESQSINSFSLLFQIFAAVALVNKTLHPANIYLTSSAFWVNVSNIDLASLLESKLVKTSNSVSQNKQPTSKPPSQSALISPYSAQNKPLVIDQSGDGKRVLLMVAAIMLLLAYLAYQYWAHNSEEVMTWVNQFVQSVDTTPTE